MALVAFFSFFLFLFLFFLFFLSTLSLSKEWIVRGKESLHEQDDGDKYLKGKYGTRNVLPDLSQQAFPLLLLPPITSCRPSSNRPIQG